MRTIITVLLSSITAILLNMPGYAGDSKTPMAVKFHNFLLPSDTSIAFSIANMPGQSNSSGTAGPCNNMDGFVGFFGTGVIEADVTPSLSGDDTPRFEPLQTRLLDKIPFSLAPGEVLPIDFKQPFASAQTIMVEIAVAPKFKHCLVSSSTAVHKSSTGDFLSFLPAQTAISFSESLSAVDFDPPTCCACVPVCACGFCD